jgi:hypothetical protein
MVLLWGQRSARRLALCLTTHNTRNKKNIHPPNGIRNHNLSRRAATELRLRPCGHWDRQYISIHVYAPKMKYTVPMNVTSTSVSVVNGYGLELRIQTASVQIDLDTLLLQVQWSELEPDHLESSVDIMNMWGHTYSPVTSSRCHPYLTVWRVYRCVSINAVSLG